MKLYFSPDACSLSPHIALAEAGLPYTLELASTKTLAPAAGTLQRYRLQEWLTFIGTEIHKSFGPMFKPGTSEEAKAQAKAQVLKRLGFVEQQLEGKQFLMGDQFTVADGYLFTVCNWTRVVGIDISALPNLNRYLERIAARPAVQKAIAEEK